MYFPRTWTLVTTFFWFSPLVSAKMLSSTPTNLSSMIFVIIFWWKSYKVRRCLNDVKLKVSMNNLFLYPFDLLKFSRRHDIIIWENSLVKPFASMPSSPMNSTSGTFWISNEPRLYSLRTSLIILLGDRCTVMSCLLGLSLTIFAWYLGRLLSGGSNHVHNGNSNTSRVSPGSRKNTVPLCYIKCSIYVQRWRYYFVHHTTHKHHHGHNFDT